MTKQLVIDITITKQYVINTLLQGAEHDAIARFMDGSRGTDGIAFRLVGHDLEARTFPELRVFHRGRVGGETAWMISLSCEYWAGVPIYNDRIVSIAMRRLMGHVMSHTQPPTKEVGGDIIVDLGSI